MTKGGKDWLQDITAHGVKQLVLSEELMSSCPQVDLVQIINYGQTAGMEATTLTVSESQGAKFKSVQTSSRASLFFLVPKPMTFDPLFLIISSDLQWVLRLDNEGKVISEILEKDATLAKLFSHTDYWFSLKGSLDNALLVSNYNSIVGLTTEGEMDTKGGASTRYHVRIVSEVDVCSSEEVNN